MGSLAKVAEDLQRERRSIERLLNKLEDLRTERRITEAEILRVYAGSLISFYASLEVSLERAFVGVVRGRMQSVSKHVKSLITVKSDSVARRVIAGNRNYVDWLPYDEQTKKRAKAFLAKGLPFANAPRDAFKEIRIVRNAVAHRSSAALKKFERQCLANTPIRPRERRPETYLRGFATPNRRRLHNILLHASKTFADMCQ